MRQYKGIRFVSSKKGEVINSSYFKNTSYLLVKIAHRFLLENSQNYVVPRGGRLGSYPLVSNASPRGSVAMAISQRAHSRFLAHAAKTHLFGLEIFAIDIPFSLSLFPFHLYPIALSCCARVLPEYCVRCAHAKHLFCA